MTAKAVKFPPAEWDKNIGSMPLPNVKGHDWSANQPLPRKPNPSGIRPVEFKVVVYPKPVQEVTAGGIHLPAQKVDSDKFAMQEGTIVAASDTAFSEDFWGSNRPKVGDVVLFAKYAGLRRQGKDGKDYVVMIDKDVCAVIE